MAIVMNMSDYTVEREEPVAEDYTEQALRAGWSPELMLACREVCDTVLNRHVAMPPSLAGIDVNSFLRAMYTYQR